MPLKAKKIVRQKSKKPALKHPQEPIVPYHRKPENLSLEAWQVALRRQFVKDKFFGIEKLDGHPVFCDYLVHNPETRNTYKVAIRDHRMEMNFCSCLDFKTNQLGTCKHIEATLKLIRSNPKLAAIFERGFIPPYTSVYLHYGKQREVKLRIGTDASVRFKNMAWEYFSNDMILTTSGFTHFEEFMTRARQIDEGFRCYDDALEYILDVREHKNRATLLEKTYPAGNGLDDLLKTTLFPYQKSGILFAARAGRSLIADEMGLGKTIQALGVAELMRSELGITRVLVICPTSLKYQWQSETVRFTGSSTQVIEGLPHIRKDQYMNDAFYKIASYHTLSNDLDAVNEMEFDLVILDEAQRIKNWKTKIARSVKKIRSPYALVLTGTPLENKLEELYSIVQFVDPFRLGPYYHFLDHYQIKNPTGRVTGYRHLHDISRALSDILIRRSKKEVLSQLPERMDKILYVAMTDKQAELHQEFADAVGRIVTKWKYQGYLSEKDRQRLMINLNLMRMMCDSTYLLDQKTRHDTKIDELMVILDEYFDGSEEKVVIFSQWERMTRLVAKELDDREIGYRYLHGSVPAKNRKELFEHFNNDPDCRVFLSTDAGSTGLNLQSASMIINLDIPWNPAVLEQRIGRVHRYGQKKKVSVINFVSTGTIEHRMINVLKFKTSLFDGILNDGEDSIFMAEDKFNEFMKTVETITSSTDEVGAGIPSVPQDIESEPLELNLFPESEKVDEQTTMEEGNPVIPGDDDVPIEKTPPMFETKEASGIESTTSTSQVPTDPAILITQGISFFSGLAQTFSSPEATQKLVSSLVEKDPQTGKTFLKIPVESEAIVTTALNLLTQLFKK